MGAIASQITSLTIVYSIVCSDADQGKHQSSESLAFVQGIHRGPGNSPHKWPVTRKMFPFDDVIMGLALSHSEKRSRLKSGRNASFWASIHGWKNVYKWKIVSYNTFSTALYDNIKSYFLYKAIILGSIGRSLIIQMGVLLPYRN